MGSAGWLLDLFMLKHLKIQKIKKKKREKRARIMRFGRNENSLLHKKIDKKSQDMMNNKLRA